MPKNAGESKSKMRFRSTRKPLRDVSNANATVKYPSVQKKISENDGGREGDDSLDRLLRVHSDISSVLRQIDELVAQALQLTSNNGRKEIKEFADLLSNTQTSLKPWVSRLKKAVHSQSSTRSENESKQPMERESLGVSEESTNIAVESPEETKWESLVSPSPLVSWRVGCHRESGRQLFLLTPLPQKKAFSSKYKASLDTLEKIPSDKVAQPSSLSVSFGNLGNDLHEGASAIPTPKMAASLDTHEKIPSDKVAHTSSLSVSFGNMGNGLHEAASAIPTPKLAASLGTLEKIPSDKVAHPSSLSISFRNLGNDLHKGASAIPTPKMALDIEVTKAASDNLRSDCASPENVSNMNRSLFTMTPCMKMSPPKSCILLGSVSAFSKKKSQVVHKSTPFPSGVHSFSESPDCESSSDQSSDGLKLKYPELYGINKENNNMQKKMVTEDSPNWIVSPPKTCVLMDPSDNCLPLKPTAESNESEGELTPMEKEEPRSSFRMGGKHPGENTLKKELWTRFEAASTHGNCFNASLLQNSTKRRGFLDILDEASDAA